MLCVCKKETHYFVRNFKQKCLLQFQGLFNVAGVPLLDYVLEALALGGVGETILFCSQDSSKIKERIK